MITDVIMALPLRRPLINTFSLFLVLVSHNNMPVQVFFNKNRFLHLWDHRHSNRNHVIRWKVTLIWSLINIDEFILGPRFTFLIPEQKVNDIRYLKSKKENLPLLSFCEDLMILVLRIIMILTFFIYLTFAGLKGPLYVFSWKCVQKWS